MRPIITVLKKWPMGELRQSWNRKESRFRSELESTLEMLNTELDYVDGVNPVIELAVRRDDISVNQWLGRNPVFTHPGVALHFQMDREPRMLCSDAFTKWTANLRGIVLTLEALRSVERWGCASDKQQYRGFAALAAPGMANNSFRSAGEAADFLAERSGWEAEALMISAKAVEFAFKEAAKTHHPDKGGDRLVFERVMDAQTFLKQHLGVG